METVELLLAVETEFGIEFPIENAPRLASAGGLHECVMQALRSRGDRVDEKAIWLRLRDLIVEHLGVRPEKVTPDTQFVRDLKAS